MAYPTIYSWPIAQDPVSSGSFAVPNPGPGVESQPSYSDARKKQFARGIRFANVPSGRSDFVVHGGPRVYHVNSVLNVTQQPIDKLDISGVVKFRGRNSKENIKQVPAKVRGLDIRSSDRFSNPVFEFTGRYPEGYQHITFDDGAWGSTSQVTGSTSYYVGQRLIDNRIFIAGGIDSSLAPLSSAFVYDSGSASWIALSPMSSSKTLAASVLLDNGDVLVVGGSGSNASEYSLSYRYLTSSNSWITASTDVIVPRKDFEIVKLQDGRVFAPGGQGLSASIPFTGSELFDPANNTWHSHPSTAPQIPLFPYDREGYTLTNLNDGSVLLVGGRDTVSLVNTDHVLRFYPNDQLISGSTSSWTVEQSMSFPRSNHKSIKLNDGRVLILGGAGGPGVNMGSQFPMSLGAQAGAPKAISEVEVYDPVKREVRHLGQMRASRSKFGISLVPVQNSEGRVLVCGGDDNNIALSSAELYDVEFNTWKTVVPMGSAVKGHILFHTDDNFPPFSFLAPFGDTTAGTGSLTTLSSSQYFFTNG